MNRNQDEWNWSARAHPSTRFSEDSWRLRTRHALEAPDTPQPASKQHKFIQISLDAFSISKSQSSKFPVTQNQNPLQESQLKRPETQHRKPFFQLAFPTQKFSQNSLMQTSVTTILKFIFDDARHAVFPTRISQFAFSGHTHKLQFHTFPISVSERTIHSFSNCNAPQSQFASLMITFVRTAFSFRAQPQFGRATGLVTFVSCLRESPRARCLTLTLPPNGGGPGCHLRFTNVTLGSPFATRARDFTRLYARTLLGLTTLRVVPRLRAGQASIVSRYRGSIG